MRSAALALIFLTVTPMAKAIDAKPEPTVLYEEDSTMLTTTIEVVVQSGASEDPSGKQGITNMLGDLILRGTKKRSRDKFQSEVERLGASVYARASHDSLIFVGRVIKENTAPFMALLSEALLTPAFSKKEFESLKTEVLAEIANMKNNNGRLSGLAVRRTLMAGSVLELPLEGSLKTVKSIQLADLQRAYNDRFNRANVLFAVASPIKEAELKKPLGELWSALPDGNRRQRSSITPKVPSSPTLVIVHKPKTSTGSIMFGQAGIVASDPARYSLAVGNFAFGGEPLVSRLFRVIRSDLGWTYAIGSTYYGMGHLTAQQGFFLMTATPAVEYSAKTILKILEMWNEYQKKGLSGDELKLARDSLVNSYPFEFDSAEKRLWQKLHSHLYGVPVLSPEEYGKTINAIDNKEIVKAVAERQGSQGWLISIVADREVIEKQLEEEQKNVPADKRLKIAKQFTPDELVQ